MSDSSRYKLVQQNPDTKLWRVQALVDIRPGVVRGDIGGWVEGEHNLSQDITSTAWVYEEAQVYGGAQVDGQAQVWGQAQVFGQAQVYGQAQVRGQAQVQKVCLYVQQPQYSMTATDTHLIIGCQAHTWEAWLGIGFISALGRRYAYSPAEIRETSVLIKALHKQVKRLTTE